ncbi:MAG: hypothetical protein ACREEP_03435, partial [Dongiaceae bacterium]
MFPAATGQYPHAPGIAAGSQLPWAGATFVRCINKTGSAIVGGNVGTGADVVQLSTTAAHWGAGKPIPVIQSGPAPQLVIGAVADFESTIPDGAQFWCQVSGYHPRVACSGTPIDIAAGDRLIVIGTPVGTFIRTTSVVLDTFGMAVADY